MRPPRRDLYEDDPEGFEEAYSRYEEAMEDERDRRRDEQAEQKPEP